MSYDSTVSALSPSSRWKLNEASSADAADSGSGGKTLTKGSSGLTWNQSSLVDSDASGKSVKFDGADVSGLTGFLGNDSYDFAGTASFTLAAWIKPDGTGAGATRRILEKLATNGWRFAHSSADKVLFQRITSSGTSTLTSNRTLSNNTRYFVVAVYDGTDMKVYVNGVLDNTLASSYSMDNTTGVVSLGCTSSRLGSYGGYLDEVTVWDGTALSASQVLDLWLAGVPPAARTTSDNLAWSESAAPPPIGTISGSGSLDGYTLGADKHGRFIVGFTRTSGSVCTGGTLQRSLDNSTWVDVTAEVIATTSGAVAIDHRPDQGLQVPGFGGACYYRFAPTGSGSTGLTGAISVTVGSPNVPQIQADWARTAHAHISAQPDTDSIGVTGYCRSEDYTGAGELQVAEWLLAMAGAAYLSTAISGWVGTYNGPTTADCIADASHQWTYIKWRVATYGGGKFICEAGEPYYVTVDGGLRPIMHSLLAARVLIRSADPTAETLALEIRSYANTWLKNYIDAQTQISTRYAGWDAASQTAWQASHSYAVGQLVRPTVANGRTYRCTVAGTSSGSQPTWPTSDGGTVTDGGVTWKETSRTYALPYVTHYLFANQSWYLNPSNTHAESGVWSSGKSLNAGFLRSSGGWLASTYTRPTVANGYIYRCSGTGTSGTSEPTWPTTPGATVSAVGGTAQWTCCPDIDYSEQFFTINKFLAYASALAMACQDCTDFRSGGSYRSGALAMIGNIVDYVIEPWQSSDGSWPYSDVSGLTGKSTLYGGFNATLLAIIKKTNGSALARLDGALSDGLDWMESAHGASEPYTAIDRAGVSGPLVGYSELAFARAAYAVLGQPFPYDDLTHSAAYNDRTTGKWTYYSQYGNGTVTGGRTGATYAPLDMEATRDGAISFSPVDTSDNLAWSDDATGQPVKARTTTDALGWTDSASRQLQRQGAGADSLGWSETATGQRVTARTTTDALGWSDAAARTLVTVTPPGSITSNMQMPPGTVVGVYRVSEWRGHLVPMRGTGSYPGPVVVEAEVDDYGEVTFEELAVGEYVAWAEDFPTRRRFFAITAD